jgi:hypothetical protein
MNDLKSLVLSAALVFLTAPLFYGQTLAPRAYVVTPVDSTAVTVTSEVRRGGVLFDASLPLTDPSGTIWLITPTYYHSLNFFGRSCNITAGLPYAVSNFLASVGNQRPSTYRSGLGDGGVRFSVNLMGGPAMKLPEFMKWKQKRVLGVNTIRACPSTSAPTAGRSSRSLATQNATATGWWTSMEVSGFLPKTRSSFPAAELFPARS